MENKFVGLIILDGWGISAKTKGNAIALAKPKNYLHYLQNYPNSKLVASGEAVGLPKGQMGNSEVGHLNIGAGRIVYQSLLKINNAIKDGSFYQNENLLRAMEHAKKHDSVLHLMGLLSDGGVHSNIDHLFTLLQMADMYGVKKVAVHAFLDGRDTYRESGIDFVKNLLSKLNKYDDYYLASVMGRYYAMDREQNYDRTKLAYDAIVYGKAEVVTDDVVRAITNSYESKVFDEFVRPIVVDSRYKGINDNDAIIHFNFREDRARQLTSALVEKFEFFSTKHLSNVLMCTFVRFDEKFKKPIVAFPVAEIEDNLSAIISQNGLKQFKVAETTKYAHVTFFLNGGIEKPYKDEKRFLIETIKNIPFEKVPEMRASEITDKAVAEILTKKYNFMALNYSNTDMVGHTGDLDAAIKAVKCVDRNLKRVVDAILQIGGRALIIADHGNAEEMIDENGRVLTDHTTNLVPCILVGENNVSLENGSLANVSSTILHLLDVDVPNTFTHSSLIVRR